MSGKSTGGGRGAGTDSLLGLGSPLNCLLLGGGGALLPPPNEKIFLNGFRKLRGLCLLGGGGLLPDFL